MGIKRLSPLGLALLKEKYVKLNLKLINAYKKSLKTLSAVAFIIDLVHLP